MNMKREIIMMKLFNKLMLYMFLALFICTSFLSTHSFAKDMESLEIYSPSVILIDYNTSKILYEKNMHERKYPASLTKVMTALIVLENCELNEVATVSKNAVTQIPSRICYSLSSRRRAIYD